MKNNRIPKDSPPAVERYTVGSGLTKRDMHRFRTIIINGKENAFQIVRNDGSALTPEDREEIAALFERINKRSTFDGRIRFAEEWARKVLAEEKPGAERKPYESATWYAEEFLFDAARLRNLVSRIQADPEGARKEADTLAILAFNLGVLAFEAMHKSFLEPHTLLGIKDRIPRRKGGKARGQQITEEADERNADVLRRNAELLAKKWPENKRAVYIADETKRSRHTIRGIIRRSK
jgi:hypothetical protein